VPVTNGICAIPEFIDESCGFLASNEDYIGLANAIEHLYHNPEDFLTKSNRAANRVRHQCSKNKMIRSELNEIIS
jgi:glycosyltransferase involved in cell wall biosynthesis